MQTASSTEALRNRRRQVNPNSGKVRWRTPFIGGAGTREESEVRNAPMAFLVEMTPDSVLPAHFHPVDQFQVFVSGSGRLGRENATGLHIHYADRHTAYGPIAAGPQGVAYFTLRAKNDARGMFLNKPGVRELLRPSKKRFRLTDTVVLSVPPVLAERETPAMEPLFAAEDAADGLAAFVLRLGANARMRGPDPALSGGQFYLVVAGTLRQAEAELPLWSLLWTAPDETAPELVAGGEGAEILVTQFPRPD